MIVLQILAILFFTILHTFTVCAVTLITFGKFSADTVSFFSRAWGRTILFLLRIRLEVKGLEHLLANQKGILIFNHTSVLDAFAVSACFPKKGLVVGKQEIKYTPFINLAWWALGFAFLPRNKGSKSWEVFLDFVKKVFDQNRTLVMAPEGTRSYGGQLLPFKMGAFYAASTLKVPVQIFVIKDAYKLWPMTAKLPKRGTLHVEILPPIDTTDWREDNLKEKIAEVRLAFESLTL